MNGIKISELFQRRRFSRKREDVVTRYTLDLTVDLQSANRQQRSAGQMDGSSNANPLPTEAVPAAFFRMPANMQQLMAPNLVELFFEGPTPEGSGYQILTDELYAEFSNASFFRPEPGRNLTLTLQAAF